VAEHAYRTADANIINEYRTALACAKARQKKITSALSDLGVSTEVMVSSTGFPGGKMRIRDLVPIGDFVPDGWRLMKSTGRLEPRRGKPGEGARQWLADHQPIDVRHVMEQHGLPRAAWIPGDGFRYRIVAPHFFEHDAALWARYAAEPGTSETRFDSQRCTWEPCKLSEFYAAYEAYQAAHPEDGGDLS
jgi:hypothetical protein